VPPPKRTGESPTALLTPGSILASGSRSRSRIVAGGDRDNLHTVAKRRLTKRAGSLRSTRAVDIKRALGHALGWLELSAL